MLEAVRRWVRENQLVVLAGVIVVCACALWMAYQAAKPASYTVGEEYVDEETGAVSTHSIYEGLPPLLGAAGRATLVRAYYFTCDGGRTRQLGYVEKFTDEAKALLGNPGAPAQERARAEREGRLLRGAPPGTAWVAAGSEEGARLQEGPLCSGGQHAERSFRPR